MLEKRRRTVYAAFARTAALAVRRKTASSPRTRRTKECIMVVTAMRESLNGQAD